MSVTWLEALAKTIQQKKCQSDSSNNQVTHKQQQDNADTWKMMKQIWVLKPNQLKIFSKPKIRLPQRAAS